MSDASTGAGAPSLIHSRDPRLWAEIAVVCAVCILPPLIGSILFFFQAYSEPSQPLIREIGLLERALPGIVLSLWMMARSGRPWREFGICRPHVPTELLLALAFAIVARFGYYAVHHLVTWAWRIAPWTWDILNVIRHPPTEGAPPPTGGAAIAITIVGVAFAATSEELVLRAYLIPRIRAASGSVLLAVLLSSALGASYHIYQGSYSMFLVFLYELTFGALFLLTPRIWSFALAHTLYNLALYFDYPSWL